MQRNVTIKSSGKMTVSNDGCFILAEVNDPLLPTYISDPLSATFNRMVSEGLSEIHMELNDARSFTHTVKAGNVAVEEGISDPLFDVLMSNKAKAKLLYIYDRQPLQEDPDA